MTNETSMRRIALAARPMRGSGQSGFSILAVLLGLAVASAGTYFATEFAARGGEAAYIGVEKQTRELLIEALDATASSSTAFAASANAAGGTLAACVRGSTSGNVCTRQRQVPFRLIDAAGNSVGGPASAPQYYGVYGNRCQQDDTKCRAFSVKTWYAIDCKGANGNDLAACRQPSNVLVSYELEMVRAEKHNGFGTPIHKDEAGRLKKAFKEHTVTPFGCPAGNVLSGYGAGGEPVCIPTPRQLKGPTGDRGIQGVRGITGLRGPQGPESCAYAQNDYNANSAYIVFHQFGYPNCRPRYTLCEPTFTPGRHTFVGGNCPGNYPAGLVRGFGGCFAPDTAILMGDGKTVLAAKDVRRGHWVWNPILRRPIEVAETYFGPEPIPLVEVAFDGRVLRVTQDHPMRTRRGSLRARELLPTDTLFLEDGRAVAIEGLRETQPDPDMVVYNFELASASDAWNEDEHWVVSDGMITGDIVLQRRLIEQAKSPTMATTQRDP